MTETDPWQPEAMRTGTAPVITSEMISTAAMVIRRMYSSDDPEEWQSGRAVVQALYPLIAAAEHQMTEGRWDALREEVKRIRATKDELAGDHEESGHDWQTERCYGAVEALDGVLALMDRMTPAPSVSRTEG